MLGVIGLLLGLLEASARYLLGGHSLHGRLVVHGAQILLEFEELLVYQKSQSFFKEVILGLIDQQNGLIRIPLLFIANECSLHLLLISLCVICDHFVVLSLQQLGFLLCKLLHVLLLELNLLQLAQALSVVSLFFKQPLLLQFFVLHFLLNAFVKQLAFRYQLLPLISVLSICDPKIHFLLLLVHLTLELFIHADLVKVCRFLNFLLYCIQRVVFFDLQLNLQDFKLILITLVKIEVGCFS